MTMTTSNPSSTSIPSPPVARPSDRDPWLATFVRRSAKVVIAVLLVAAGFWLGASVRPTYEATRSGAASHTPDICPACPPEERRTSSRRT